MEPSTSMDQGGSSKSHRGQQRTASTFLDQGFPSKSHFGQKRPRLQNVTPKHKIFLSHSGQQSQQKEFVRQLCKDLEAACYQPFFDERSSSLPKGEPFVTRLFEAARECVVAVILLSEDFLTSKWPMLELVEFVKAKKSHNPHLKLLPLFYMLSPEDLKLESNERRWKVAWAEIITPTPEEGIPLDGTRRHLNLRLCMDALGELRGTNGLKFENFSSEVAYREAIVKEIFLLVPPNLLYDTSDVIGLDRLCEVIGRMFVEHRGKDGIIYKLGLYGMSGLGKTTMSRALCMSFHMHFFGRVLHVELGTKPVVELQKLVLTKLLQVNKDVVKGVHSDFEGLMVLKEHMNRQAVFLVIDNVTDDEDSRKQARAFLEVGFHPGSMIMVTSRSLDVVEYLFPSELNAMYCKAMPKLSEEEARLIFMQRAAPNRDLDTLTMEEHKILDKCISEGLFCSGDFERQYHPLALHALGAYYHSEGKENMLTWKKHFGDDDKLRHPTPSAIIFCALEKQISTLSFETKLLFFDLCLYIEGKYTKHYSEDWKLLADFHRIPTKEVKTQLQVLKRLGVIEIDIHLDGFGDGYDVYERISMHDLYREFAKWYVMHIEDGRKLGCVYHMDSIASLPLILDSTSSSPSPWKRIRLENLTCVRFPLKRVQEWCNVVVLQIHKCSKLIKLDLSGLRCLCLLELVELSKLESFHFENPWVASNNVSNDTHESLKHIVLRGLTSLKQIPNFGMCTLLKTFEMKGCAKLLPKPPSFIGCSDLEDLRLNWNWQWRMEELKVDTLTSLIAMVVNNEEVMDVDSWDKVREQNIGNFLTIVGLGNCSMLEILILEHLPINSLKGLDKLIELKQICIVGCQILLEIPNISTLTKLEHLSISNGLFQQILGVEKLFQLRYLELLHCYNLTSLPDLFHLRKLLIVNSSLMVKPQLPSICGVYL